MTQLTLEDIQGFSDDQARALVIEAKNREVLDEDQAVPSDSGKLQELAGKLVQLSIDEWYRSTPAELRGQIGEDVKALLGLVGVTPEGEELIVIDHVIANETEGVSDAVSTDEPEAADEAPEADAAGAEEPWDGYDADIVPNVLKKLSQYKDAGQLDDGAIAYVLNYEREHKARKGIIEFLSPTEKAEDGNKELDDQLDAAVAKDEDGGKVPVTVEGVKARWEWDDVVRHVVENGNTNLTLDDVTHVAELDRLMSEKAQAKLDAEEATERAAKRAEETSSEESTNEPATDAADDRPTHLAGVQEASSFLTSFRKERLPEPEQPKFAEDPKLPNNLTDLSEPALQQLYMDFGACLSRANWLLGLAHAEESRLERIAKRERAKAILKHKDVKPEQVRNATVDLDDEVVKWEDAHNDAEQDVKGYTRLASAYQGNVDRLSRVMAFRLAEAERARA